MHFPLVCFPSFFLKTMVSLKTSPLTYICVVLCFLSQSTIAGVLFQFHLATFSSTCLGIKEQPHSLEILYCNCVKHY